MAGNPQHPIRKELEDRFPAQIVKHQCAAVLFAIVLGGGGTRDVAKAIGWSTATAQYFVKQSRALDLITYETGPTGRAVHRSVRPNYEIVAVFPEQDQTE